MSHRTLGRKLDPHALFCREFGHPLDPFLVEDDGLANGPFYYCRWCGECGGYNAMPYLAFPLSLSWELACVAWFVASEVWSAGRARLRRKELVDEELPF